MITPTFPKRILFTALSIAVAGSFLLCGYEFIRAVSTSLFIDAYGARNLPRVMVAVPPSVFLLLYLYGRLLVVAGRETCVTVDINFVGGIDCKLLQSDSHGLPYCNSGDLRFP